MSSLPRLLAALLGAALATGAHAEVVRVDDGGFGVVAGRVQVGGPLRVEGVPLAPNHENATLDLTRFEIFGPDAVIVVHGDKGEARLAPPRHLFFRGHVEGDPGSTAYLSVRESGAVVAIVTLDDGLYQMSVPPGEGSRGVTVRRLEGNEERAFRCDTDTTTQQPVGDSGLEAPKAFPPVSWTARVAVETDYEFYNKFGSSAGATDYIADLFGYASKAYEEELATEWRVTYLSLWSTPSDPWTATSSSAALTEFRTYWNTNHTGVSRTIAHFVSSRSTGGGIAYVGVLCSMSVGYGFSGNIAGNFNPGNPVPGWDIIVVSHEIGHNFNSPHTHDYCNIGGNSNPVDLCYTSSTCGSALGLPGVGSLTGGTAGNRNGTFMSYCHLLGGGYGNIALRFGEGHPYGILAQRVPDRMLAHVQSLAASNPACLSLDLIFRDRF